MQRSDSIAALAAALAKAQAELRPAEMNSVNPFLKNRYADLGAVIEVLRPVLPRHGLSFMQHAVSGDGERIEVETIIMHESGEWQASSIGLPLGEERGKSAAQVAGSIITYLRRYALSSAFGIYADEDTDGGNPHKPQPRQPTPQEQTDRLAAAGRTLPAPADEWEQLPGGGPKPAAQETAPDMVTDAQRKAIFAIWMKVYGDQDALRPWLRENYGTEHTKELTRAQASRIIETLKASAPQ